MTVGSPSSLYEIQAWSKVQESIKRTRTLQSADCIHQWPTKEIKKHQFILSQGMEEEAKLRRSRLLGLAGVNDEINMVDEQAPVTAETLAQKILSESIKHFEEQVDSSDDRIKRPNWDLKKEYERRIEKLEEERIAKLNEMLESERNS